MTNVKSANPPTLLGTWLQSLGFHHGNPFATNEADRERALLPNFFVDVESYDLIKGDQTVIVFAPRGGGKSSLRVVLASYGAPWSPKASILTVECTDFDTLIDLWKIRQSLTIGEYVSWLLPAGVKSLFDTFFYDDSSQTVRTATNIDSTDNFLRVSSLTAPVRARLARVLHTYCPYLLTIETIGRLLSFYAPEFVIDNWLQFARAVKHNQLSKFVMDHDLFNHECIALLAELNDFGALVTATSMNSPKARLADFVELVRDVGFTTVHFLLDRLDETIETANDPKAQADILEPLLAHLPILEMPGVAFKFFLSQETRDALWDRPTVRQEDRLAEYAVTLKWDEARLKKLLDERLQSYSAHPVTGTPEVSDLEAICVESTGQQITIGKQIEQAMISRAQSLPRRLIIAGRLLFESHLVRQGGKGHLDWDDWLRAEKELLHKFPPLLQVNQKDRILLLGQQVIKLSRQEGKIIETLIQAEGRCSREELALGVWDSLDVGNEAMDQAVNRLRRKLDDDATDPVYLKTIREQGFQLYNYELI